MRFFPPLEKGIFRRFRRSPRQALVFVGNTAVHSATLRGLQLAEIARLSPVLARVPITFTDSFEFSNSVAFLTKSVLRDAHTLDQIKSMKARRNLLVADFLDRAVAQHVLPYLDGLIASSIRQLHEYRDRYPQMPSALVTHHADLRIAGFVAPSDRLRVGYFGELFNARYRDALSDVVDFVAASTQKKLDRRGSWLSRLQDYNCHYLMREEIPGDQFKPFTKGFIAARCRSPIIVERTESDAAHYLSADYPYFVDDASENGLRSLIRQMADDFGGKRWQSAINEMDAVAARSSTHHIAQELEMALAPLVSRL